MGLTGEHDRKLFVSLPAKLHESVSREDVLRQSAVGIGHETERHPRSDIEHQPIGTILDDSHRDGGFDLAFVYITQEDRLPCQPARLIVHGPDSISVTMSGG